MRVDIAYSSVQTPDATLTGRFIYFNGTVVLWAEGNDKVPQRLLYGTGASFVKRTKANETHRVIFEDSSEWHIRQTSSGGCGCNRPLKPYSYAQLLAEPPTI